MEIQQRWSLSVGRTQALVSIPQTFIMWRLANYEDLLEYRQESDCTQWVAAKLLDTGNMSNWWRPALAGRRIQDPWLFPLGYQRYRWACPLRIRRRLDAHHPPYPLRQGNTQPHPIYHSAARHHPQARRNHYRMLLRNQYDDRLRKLSAETRRRIHRLCGYDIPTLPLFCRMVSETTQTDQFAHREGKEKSWPRREQREPDRPEPPAGLPHLLHHLYPRQRNPAL